MYNRRWYDKYKETEIAIAKGKVFCTSCMKEFVEAKPFNELVQRVILPIYHMNNRIGVIVVLTKQKTKFDDAIEVLDGVSTQLGSAIIQAELYEKNTRMVKELTYVILDNCVFYLNESIAERLSFSLKT